MMYFSGRIPRVTASFWDIYWKFFNPNSTTAFCMLQSWFADSEASTCMMLYVCQLLLLCTSAEICVWAFWFAGSQADCWPSQGTWWARPTKHHHNKYVTDRVQLIRGHYDLLPQTALLQLCDWRQGADPRHMLTSFCKNWRAICVGGHTVDYSDTVRHSQLMDMSASLHRSDMYRSFSSDWHMTHTHREIPAYTHMPLRMHWCRHTYRHS